MLSQRADRLSLTSVSSNCRKKIQTGIKKHLKVWARHVQRTLELRYKRPAIQLSKCFNTHCHKHLPGILFTPEGHHFQSFVLFWRTIKVFLEMRLTRVLVNISNQMFGLQVVVVVVGGTFQYVQTFTLVFTLMMTTGAITQCSRCPGNIFSSIN